MGVVYKSSVKIGKAACAACSIKKVWHKFVKPSPSPSISPSITPSPSVTPSNTVTPSSTPYNEIPVVIIPTPFPSVTPSKPVTPIKPVKKKKRGFWAWLLSLFS